MVEQYHAKNINVIPIKVQLNEESYKFYFLLIASSRNPSMSCREKVPKLLCFGTAKNFLTPDVFDGRLNLASPGIVRWSNFGKDVIRRIWKRVQN